MLLSTSDKDKTKEEDTHRHTHTQGLLEGIEQGGADIRGCGLLRWWHPATTYLQCPCVTASMEGTDTSWA